MQESSQVTSEETSESALADRVGPETRRRAERPVAGLAGREGPPREAFFTA